MNTAARLLVDELRDAGVRRIYAMSGNQLLSVFEAAQASGLPLLHVRQEAAAVHMADAFGRLTGRPGVALVAAGPSLANAAPALMTALEAESPLLLVSVQAGGRDDSRRRDFQYLDQAAYTEPLTKRSYLATDPATLPEAVSEAMGLAASGRPGPVHVAIPHDILDFAVGERRKPPSGSGMPLPVPLTAPDGAAIASFLDGVRRPIAIGGPAMGRLRAAEAMAAFSEDTGIPAVVSESPRGLRDPRFGEIALVVADADAVLLIGRKLDWSLDFGSTRTFRPDCRVLQVDLDPAVLESTVRLLGPARSVSTVLADPVGTLKNLSGRLQVRIRPAWTSEVRRALASRPENQPGSTPTRSLHPAEVCRAMDEFLGPDDVFVADGGEFGQWAQALVGATHVLTNGPAGAIGASVPFAIGAAHAMPGSRVLVAVGDGGFGFHAMEIDTAVRCGIRFVVVVGNDSRWNTESCHHRKRFGTSPAAYELAPVRYDLLAGALGAHGERVTTPEQLRPALQRAFESRLPACVNAIIGSEPSPAMAS